MSIMQNREYTFFDKYHNSKIISKIIIIIIYPILLNFLVIIWIKLKSSNIFPNFFDTN